MAMESKIFQMETITRAITIKGNLKVQGNITGKMDLFIKDSLLGDTEKVKEHG